VDSSQRWALPRRKKSKSFTTFLVSYKADSSSLYSEAAVLTFSSLSINLNFALQGSGKTTLLNTLAGKLADEKSFFLWGNTAEVRGKALLNGLSLSGSEIRKFMGYAKNPFWRIRTNRHK